MGSILYTCFTLAFFGQVFAASNKVLYNVNEAVDDERIIGGYKAETGEFPYQISMRFKGQNHFCGGSILNENYLLTAAHCINGLNASDVIIVTGTNTLSSGGESYPVKRLIPHPKYIPSNFTNDIALVELQNSIIFNDQVKSVKLYTENVDTDLSLTLSGWGTTSYPGKSPDALQGVHLISITNDKCAKEFEKINGIIETNLCTFTMTGQGACHGDSGGPLVYDGEQVGVVSWGFPCAKGKPDVFTRVLNYQDWIAEVMKSDENSSDV